MLSGIVGGAGGGGALSGLLKGVAGGGGPDKPSPLAGLLGDGGACLGGILGKLGEIAMGFFSSLLGALKGGGTGGPTADAKLGAAALDARPVNATPSAEHVPERAMAPSLDAPAPAAEPGAAKPTVSGKAFPVLDGKVTGHPNQGTHTLGNWQSDNALDIEAPEGTPIYAPADGVITKAAGNNDDPSSRFNGFNFELEGSDNAWFMQHLSKSLVKDGDHVKQGQLIGHVGSANNNSHLHIGQREGNPDETFTV